ncbi:MAG TPA: EAL domain-containing protein [Burkholderiales bacterium]|nr:EAL domain-containing protein [Burkholderiales bacterium]
MGEGVTASALTPPPVPPSGPTRRQAIFAEQVRHLFRFSTAAYAGSILCMLLVVGGLWPVAPVAQLVVWGFAMAAVTAARFMLYRAYMERQPPAEEAPRWCAHFVLGAGAVGVLWGVLGSVMYPAGSMPHEFLVILIIAGMVVSAILSLAPVHHAFLAFLIPAVLPIIPTVFLQGTTVHFYLGVLMLVFLVVMLATGPLVAGMLQEAIAMKFENNDLLERISETHAASRQANHQLNEQIYAQRVMAEQLRQASQKLAAMIEASPLAIIARDPNGRVESWNSAAEKIFGWSQDEVRGQLVPFHLADAGAEAEALRRKILAGESVSNFEAVRLRKDGKLIDVSLSAALVRDESGRPSGYITMFADITERKRVEKQQNVIARITMILSEAQSVEDAIPEVIETLCESFGFAYGARWVLDKQNLLLRCAEIWSVPEVAAFREVSRSRLERPGAPEGLTRRVWASASPVWVSDIEKDGTLMRRAEALSAGLKSAFAFPIMIGGEFYGLMEFFAREVRQPDEALTQLAQNLGAHIGQFIARKQAERNLQFVASHDALTGLFNRSMFSQRLQQALAQAHRHERRLAVLFIDLDGFKLINDTLGHDAGDVLLADLAVRLREVMREGDTLGRMGGDEFVVLIEGYREDTQLLEVARKVLETVAQPFLLRDGSYNVTASIGIAAYPQDGHDAAELLKNADIAMYRAKQQGKNNFQFHSSEMNTHLVERLNLEMALRRALERGELTLFYQPRVNLKENRVTGVESLVRWVHPSQGVLNPPEFVPLAEDAGLFAAIGDWVLHAACGQLKAWQQRGIGSLRIAVNLSMRQFGQDNLIERLREAVHNAGIEAKQLEIEITEAILMRHSDRAAKLLAQVKDMGAHVVVDDFGTGYSSLGNLKRFPIDAIKIDRSLVSQLPGADAASLTRAVIAMAHSLNQQVIAEGVETRQQWDFLSEHGCEAMQGNYFCAPAPEEAITAMLLQPPHGAVRLGNVQQFRPWRGPRPGGEDA